jgi:hypothetical protein
MFQDKQWSKLMTKLCGKYHEEANRVAGKPAVEGNKSSTWEDREWMATGCIWDGTAETAEFWHLLNTSYHCSGRCSEFGKLSSHCDRGGSNQVVVETPGLSLAAVFRTGWANRGHDTLWEYISNLFILCSQAGKALSRWLHRIGDVIHGGQPPSFDNIGGYHGSPLRLRHKTAILLQLR